MKNILSFIKIFCEEKLQGKYIGGFPLLAIILSINYWFNDCKIITTIMLFIVTIFIFSYYKVRYTIIFIVAFFSTSFLCINYLSYSDVNKLCIVENNGINSIGESGNHLILVNNSDLKVGYEYLLEGKFTKALDLNKGYYGIYDVENIKECKKTYRYFIIRLRGIIKDKYSEKLDKKAAMKIDSLLLGDTSTLPSIEKEKMKSLGIYHIISISGFHLSLLFKLLDKFTSKTLSIVFILSYIIFLGAPVPVLRAFIMILINIFSYKLYRNYDGVNALIISAIIILILNPIKLYSLGFLLSYAGVFGIYFFNDFFKKKLIFLPETIGESIAVSISATVATAPFIFATIKGISVNCIIANLFLAPIFSLIIALIFISLFSIFFNPVLDFLCYVINIVSRIIDYMIDKLYYNTLDEIFFSSEVAILLIAYIFIAFLYKSNIEVKRIILGTTILFYIFILNPIHRVELIKYKDSYGIVEREAKNSTFYYYGKIKSMKEEEFLKKYLLVNEIYSNANKKFDIINCRENYYYQSSPVVIDTYILEGE
ncbi:putative membrane protein [Clostridium bornimense]|uniref:Putative membrane protein n=1 Tax=Clostridium bornimense TaxID=1216932 RepID=W6RW84_9CLOT|nr:ComEC/Rec2 family competence protein [Clostridium bornimense]CDM68648.1 putative membrane protein [Clostridium bornimense]